MSDSAKQSIVIRGARQNNLRGLDLQIPTHQLIVVTGVSGSGKSSLVFDTLYAEGQRRYVETFSPYARQFLDRMDKPQVDRIDGIPPAIAIDQTNPVRTSRSTVGTMTELNDHLKLLYARAARLYCKGCGAQVQRDTPDTIYAALTARLQGQSDDRLLVTFTVNIPKNFSAEEILDSLTKQGYTRIHERGTDYLEVLQDRLRFSTAERSRVIEAIEAAARFGHGRVIVRALDADGQQRACWRFSSDLHCAECDIHYRDPVPSLFSFNSPIGACETCRGFGRTIGIDYGLVIPDEAKSLRGGAIRPWQTPSYAECQDDLVKFARKRSIPLDIAWRELSEDQRRWVIEGEGSWEDKLWYGVQRFFAWLESKSYKMHIRVLLSKYRAYTPCPACAGARLKTEALLWRLGSAAEAATALAPEARFRPAGVRCTAEVLAALPGLNIHELTLLPLARVRQFFSSIKFPPPLDQAAEVVLGEIRTRLNYLDEVGLGYLTLDRQSRTLSGGEVQRINLTTALGTSLVNMLFVLDEPSIGLHPRDIARIVAIIERLKQSGNSLVVVEHDPQIMQAADLLLDIGPGPGARGGEIVFYGSPRDLHAAKGSLTADYLLGRKSVASPSDLQPTAFSLQPSIEASASIRLLGAAEHNLKDIDVEIPLRRMVCVTGVSGSGKSTLVEDVLYPALLKSQGKPTEAAGVYRSLQGADQVDQVVLVDQSRIGRTTRSNPASYVGAFDAIRKLFAAEPLAMERGYTTGTFSFNSGDGRCPTCMGTGFEHIEMQFLSDVYLRCPDCDAKRYRPEILEIKLTCANGAGKNIAEVLDLTAAEAATYFSAHAEVLLRIQPLAEVGLDYMKLGQPVPTLSGGEAQRLKLAGHLAQARKASRPPDAGKKETASSLASRQPPVTSAPSSGTLFIFDEPTTGLHFDDIAKLLRALRLLIAAGHSLLIIEHNLDVIAACDWIIDLGPEGGDAGGEIVCAGTVEQVQRCERSYTGRALKDYGKAAGHWPLADSQKDRVTGVKDANFSSEAHNDALASIFLPAADLHSPAPSISIRGAREHNLQNVSVDLPRDKFTVITGVSGSGKSTLAFDIVFAEGQRRYLESLNAYAAVRAARIASGRRCDFRHSTDRSHRAENQSGRPQEHGGDADRGLSFPAPAVSEARHAILPGLRRADRTAELRIDHRAYSAAVS